MPQGQYTIGCNHEFILKSSTVQNDVGFIVSPDMNFEEHIPENVEFHALCGKNME